MATLEARFLAHPKGSNVTLHDRERAAEKNGPSTDDAILVSASYGRWFEILVEKLDNGHSFGPGDGLELGVTSVPLEKFPLPLPADLTGFADYCEGHTWCNTFDSDGVPGQLGLYGESWKQEDAEGVGEDRAFRIGDVIRFEVCASGNVEVSVNQSKVAHWAPKPSIPGSAVLRPLVNAQGTPSRIRFLAIGGNASAQGVLVRKEIHSFWATVFEDEECKDITLLLNDAAEERVHGNVLMAASPVFKGMLNHDMQERRSRTIELKPFARSEVRFALRLLYTSQVDPHDWMAPSPGTGGVDGSAVVEAEDASRLPPLGLLCRAFLFSRKYLVEPLIPFLLQKITERITEETLETILAFAIQEDVVSLRLASLHFAEFSTKIRQRVESDEGSFSPEVLEELRTLYPNIVQVGSKRKFTLL